jgi:16S rRNA A1518/A1519 N6-dimethyltransferase RsmA/KsgA/DIM1 with predicted DNA glycosylase/AP lyase activity
MSFAGLEPPPNVDAAIVTVLPTAPRILTQAQLYSINQITKNNENNTIYKSTAPTTPDTFAIIQPKSKDQLNHQ